jgi:hypothetical protein
VKQLQLVLVAAGIHIFANYVLLSLDPDYLHWEISVFSNNLM